LIDTFAKNIVSEALANKDSFIFHEAEEYESGLLGYHKPLTQAMFSNYPMVEEIGTLLDPDFPAMQIWDATQWEAYCRLVLTTFRDYVDRSFGTHSYVLYRAKGHIEDNAISDLYKLDGLTKSDWDKDVQGEVQRLWVVVQFINDAIKILDKKDVPKHLLIRMRKRRREVETFYDHLADMIFKIIFAASAIRSPFGLCWTIQHNSVWGELFNFDHNEGPAGKIIKFKVRRLIYDEIKGMKRFGGNYKAARILGFCLNIMSFTPTDQSYFRDSKALHKAILSWVKKNYASLYSDNPHLAEACLVDGFKYDPVGLRIIHKRQALESEPQFEYFRVDAPPPEKEDSKGQSTGSDQK
jgi:hypothetical protein